MLQFEVKTYKNQRKGFTEVTGSFEYIFPDCKSPQDDLLSWLINKKKIPKANFFFQNSFQSSIQFSMSIPFENIRKPKPLVF